MSKQTQSKRVGGEPHVFGPPSLVAAYVGTTRVNILPRAHECAPVVAAPHPGLCTMSRSTRTASSLLMFSKFMSFTCKTTSEKIKTRRPAQNPRRNAARFHLLSAVLTHLQQHVPGLDAAICCHGSALHDGADVDSSVASLVALADDADAQKVVLLCRSGVHKVTRHSSQRNSDMEYDPDLQNKASSFTTWARIVVCSSALLLNDQPSNS